MTSDAAVPAVGGLKVDQNESSLLSPTRACYVTIFLPLLPKVEASVWLTATPCVRLAELPPTTLCCVSKKPEGDVLFYYWLVPEAERQDSAIKRNKEALTVELKLWEGYLKVSCSKRTLLIDWLLKTRSQLVLTCLFTAYSTTKVPLRLKKKDSDPVYE